MVAVIVAFILAAVKLRAGTSQRWYQEDGKRSSACWKCACWKRQVQDTSPDPPRQYQAAYRWIWIYVTPIFYSSPFHTLVSYLSMAPLELPYHFISQGLMQYNHRPVVFHIFLFYRKECFFCLLRLGCSKDTKQPAIESSFYFSSIFKAYCPKCLFLTSFCHS